MAPKAVSRVMQIDHITSTEANILKQDMLSLGGDVAVPYSCVTGGKKLHTCVIIGTESQFFALQKKLLKQPLRLKEIAKQIKSTLQNYKKIHFSVSLPRRNMTVGKRPLIMAVINRTPDSFSDAGLYYDEDACIRRVYECIEKGADIIDIGGESTRPGAKSVSQQQEYSRVIPIVKKLAKKIKVPISIDTTKASIAKAALDSGADIINDISGLHRDKKMGKVIAEANAGCVIMHCKGTPKTMQQNPEYSDVVAEILLYFRQAKEKAQDVGIQDEQLIFDPGIGFGKTFHHNLQILHRLSEFAVLGRPLLVGTSRKSFLGEILNTPIDQRLYGSLASVAWAISSGAHIVRVHDVVETKQVVSVVDAIIRQEK